MSKAKIIKFRDGLSDYRDLLTSSRNVLAEVNFNQPNIRSARSSLIAQFALIEHDIARFSQRPMVADPVWRQYQDAYALALSSDILQRVGPAIDATLDDLEYVIARYTNKKSGNTKKNIAKDEEYSPADNKEDIIAIVIRKEVYDHIKNYLDNKDYFHAVEESYKVVKEKLREITGNEKASDIFNMNAENDKYYLKLFGENPKSGSTQRDFLRGIGYLNLAIQFLRNEKSHSLATTLDKNLAIHYISLASLSYDLISRPTKP